MSRLLPLAAVPLVTACLAAPPETTAAGMSEPSRIMHWTGARPRDWPRATRWSFGQSTAEHYAVYQFVLGDPSDGSPATPSSVSSEIDVHGDAYFLRHPGVGRIRLTAQTDGWPFSPTQIATDFGIVLRHRPERSQYAWRTLNLPDPDRARVFPSPLFVDREHQGFSISTDGTWGWLSFAEAGVTEPDPEWLVSAVPWDSFQPGTFDWGLEALCGGDLCDATDRSEAGGQPWGLIFPGEPWIGATFSDLDEPDVVIASVVPGGPAEGAALRAGDVILQVEGRAVERGRDVAAAIAGTQIGTMVLLTVRRQDDIVHDVSVLVTGRPDLRQRAAR